jgi:hypothetical protein
MADAVAEQERQGIAAGRRNDGENVKLMERCVSPSKWFATFYVSMFVLFLVMFQIVFWLSSRCVTSAKP